MKKTVIAFIIFLLLITIASVFMRSDKSRKGVLDLKSNLKDENGPPGDESRSRAGMVFAIHVKGRVETIVDAREHLFRKSTDSYPMKYESLQNATIDLFSGNKLIKSSQTDINGYCSLISDIDTISSIKISHPNYDSKVFEIGNLAYDFKLDAHLEYPPNMLKGIFSSDGNPLSDLKVHINDISVTTDIQGRFAFDAFSVKTDRISVVAETYEFNQVPFSIEREHVNSGIVFLFPLFEIIERDIKTIVGMVLDEDGKPLEGIALTNQCRMYLTLHETVV